MFYVYVLKSDNSPKSYVGFTNDIERRLGEHNQGHHTYTKRYAPWSVVHKEMFGTISEARNRERYFKSTAGRRYLKKIFQNLAL